ncbi:MAG: AEC family transporter [Lentisphaeraceae bacterium]|nr:AEC family transporter [Lentisphaeraceae bacterium]
MFDILSIVFNSIFPVFALILLGSFLFKIKFLNVEVQKGLNNIAYWIALPIFLFYKVANAKLEASTAGNIFICMMSGTIAAMILGYVISLLRKKEKAFKGASVQASGRGNLAFVALPVILFTVAESAGERSQVIVDSVILVLTPTIIVYNLICVSVLIAHSSKPSKNLSKDILKGLATNPLIIACVLGLVWNFSGITMSKAGALFRICNILGQAAFPMALLGVGSQLAQIKIRGNLAGPIQCALLKTVFAPLVGYGVSLILGMDKLETLTVLIMLATPTAVAAYVLADQLECEPDLTASSIFVSTVISFFSFAVLLILFR